MNKIPPTETNEKLKTASDTVKDVHKDSIHPTETVMKLRNQMDILNDIYKIDSGEPTVEKWETWLDSVMLFNKPLAVEGKRIIKQAISHSVQEAKAERDTEWLKRMNDFERINSLPHDLIAGWKWLKREISPTPDKSLEVNKGGRE